MEKNYKKYLNSLLSEADDLERTYATQRSTETPDVRKVNMKKWISQYNSQSVVSQLLQGIGITDPSEKKVALATLINTLAKMETGVDDQPIDPSDENGKKVISNVFTHTENTYKQTLALLAFLKHLGLNNSQLFKSLASKAKDMTTSLVSGTPIENFNGTDAKLTSSLNTLLWNEFGNGSDTTLSGTKKLDKFSSDKVTDAPGTLGDMEGFLDKLNTVYTNAETETKKHGSGFSVGGYGEEDKLVMKWANQLRDLYGDFGETPKATWDDIKSHWEDNKDEILSQYDPEDIANIEDKIAEIEDKLLSLGDMPEPSEVTDILNSASSMGDKSSINYNGLITAINGAKSVSEIAALFNTSDKNNPLTRIRSTQKPQHIPADPDNGILGTDEMLNLLKYVGGVKPLKDRKLEAILSDEGLLNTKTSELKADLIEFLNNNPLFASGEGDEGVSQKDAQTLSSIFTDFKQYDKVANNMDKHAVRMPDHIMTNFLNVLASHPRGLICAEKNKLADFVSTNFGSDSKMMDYFNELQGKYCTEVSRESFYDKMLSYINEK